jgi:cytochrome c oxidase assembly protein subunit 11
MPRRTKRNNAAIALTLVGVVTGMVGLSFAAVPLYDLFCRVTGFGGTTQEASVVPGETGQRVFTVRFNADVNPKLPWAFAPEQRAVEVKAGEQGLAFYVARNLAQCFCFDEQRLDPGQEAQMGVSFFVDPAILDDPGLDDVDTITLSYTFFRNLDDLPGETDGARMSSESSRGAGERARHSIN